MNLFIIINRILPVVFVVKWTLMHHLDRLLGNGMPSSTSSEYLLDLHILHWLRFVPWKSKCTGLQMFVVVVPNSPRRIEFYFRKMFILLLSGSFSHRAWDMTGEYRHKEAKIVFYVTQISFFSENRTLHQYFGKRKLEIYWSWFMSRGILRGKAISL